MRCAWLMLALLACKGDDAPPVDTPVPGTCDTPPTWETFGKGFATSWCTPCHAASLPTEERQGAPVGVDFDTLDDMLQWGARVHARAVEAADMPPGGGPSDTELALLDTFLACGMPGEATPTPRCSAPATVVGDADLAAPSDVDALCAEGDVIVDGDVHIDADLGDLACLCEVTGTVTVGQQVAQASLPSLERAGELLAHDNLVAGQLSLPALQVIDGDLDIKGHGPVELPSLTTVHGRVQLIAQEHIDLGRLATVGEALVVEGVPAAEVSMPRLASAGAIEVLDADELQQLRFDSLTACGALSLERLPQLELATGFDSLTALDGSLSLQQLGATQLVALGKLVEVHGTLTLSDLPQLEAVGGLRALTTIDGDLTVSEVPLVPSDDLTTWADGIEVGGTVTLPEEPAR